MSIEALWSLEFQSNTGYVGGGIVVFESERVFGGDSSYFYTGKYSIENGTLRGTVNVSHYNGQPISIFGPLNKFQIELNGMVSDQTMLLGGYLSDNPDKKIVVRCFKKAPLP